MQLFVKLFSDNGRVFSFICHQFIYLIFNCTHFNLHIVLSLILYCTLPDVECGVWELWLIVLIISWCCLLGQVILEKEILISMNFTWLNKGYWLIDCDLRESRGIFLVVSEIMNMLAFYKNDSLKSVEKCNQYCSLSQRAGAPHITSPTGQYWC